MKFKDIPLSLISAFIATLLYYLFAIISISHFPTSFNPLTDLWSHLKWFNYNPSGALYFRIGSIIFGILLIPYFIGWNKWSDENRIQKLSIRFFQVIGYFLAIIVILNEIFADINVLFSILSVLSLFLIIIILIIPPVILFKHPQFIKLISIYTIITIGFNFYFAYLILTDAIIAEFRSIELITVILNHGYICMMGYNIMKIEKK